MAHFKLLSGKHSDVNGKEYSAGDIIETEDDLELMFVNKFQRIPKPVGKKVADESTKKVAAPPAEKEGEEVEKVETPAEEKPSPFGIDVSDQFGAAAVGLRVFRNEEGFTVVDDSEPDKALNDSPLKNVKMTQKFVDKNAKV